MIYVAVELLFPPRHTKFASPQSSSHIFTSSNISHLLSCDLALDTESFNPLVVCHSISLGDNCVKWGNWWSACPSTALSGVYNYCQSLTSCLSVTIYLKLYEPQRLSLSVLLKFFLHQRIFEFSGLLKMFFQNLVWKYSLTTFIKLYMQ